MKKLDARFYTTVGAAGELFSIRTALFKADKEAWIIDDFMIAMQVCLQGYRMAYEPGAFATEAPSVSLAEEQKRKIRIAAGAYQAAACLGKALNFCKSPRLAFQYFSRRIRISSANGRPTSESHEGTDMLLPSAIEKWLDDE